MNCRPTNVRQSYEYGMVLRVIVHDDFDPVDAEIRDHNESVAKETGEWEGGEPEPTIDDITGDFVRGVWPEQPPPAGGSDLV